MAHSVQATQRADLSLHTQPWAYETEMMEIFKNFDGYGDSGEGSDTDVTVPD